MRHVVVNRHGLPLAILFVDGRHHDVTLAVATVEQITISDNGTPRPSTRTCRLLPFFPLSAGFGPTASCANGP